MENLLPIAIDTRWKSILGAVFCSIISFLGFMLTWVNCGRHGEGSGERCMQFAARNPYVLLSLLFLIALGIAATRPKGIVSRKILMWWAIFFLAFLGWFFAMA